MKLLLVALVGTGLCGAMAAQDSLLQPYVGQYKGSSGTATSVYLDGGRLYEETAASPRFEMVVEPGKTDEFTLAGVPFHMVFARDASGAVKGFKAIAPEERTIFAGDRFSTEGKRLNTFPDYVKSDVMIPVRDGAKLHATIFRPKDDRGPLPFLMERTPYGVDGYIPQSVIGAKPELATSGYIFVFEDIRGRYKSEGQFVMNRPIVSHAEKAGVDETTDTRDTIDWLLKNVPANTGKVGVYGVSYPGFLAMMAGIDAHPAVKAISPQAPMTDVWMGDDFFHNGAFRETYGFDYVQQLEAQKTDARVQSTGDTYDFFLQHVNFAGAAKTAGMTELPTAARFLNEPAYTKFWRDMAVEDHLTRVEVPTLEVGGFWDQEDMWGTQEEYRRLHAVDTEHEVFMVLGPWNHGGWGGPGTSLGGKFGKLEFGQPTGTEYRQTIEYPFFELYLKGKPGFDLKGVASFRTGVNQWQRYAVWPPVSGFSKATLRLGTSESLRFEQLAENQKTAQVGSPVLATYTADPADPVPYRNRPVQATYGNGSLWRTWLVEDQRFLDGRKDIASFRTPVLAKDVTVTGDVAAKMRIATTGTDGDFVVKLIDVSPDGTETMIADEIFRGRYRESFETAHAIPAGMPEEYDWSLHGADHTFLKGHRMMVSVQSSWFPLYDRNPQTFVPNIMTAPASAYQKATVTILGGSRLEFLTPIDPSTASAYTPLAGPAQ